MAIGSTVDAIDPIAGLNSLYLAFSDVIFGIAIKMLTGNDCDKDSLIMPNADAVRDKIETALSAKKVVIAAINNVPQWSWIKWLVGDRKGWPTAHEPARISWRHKLLRGCAHGKLGRRHHLQQFLHPAF